MIKKSLVLDNKHVQPVYVSKIYHITLSEHVNIFVFNIID